MGRWHSHPQGAPPTEEDPQGTHSWAMILALQKHIPQDRAQLPRVKPQVPADTGVCACRDGPGHAALTNPQTPQAGPARSPTQPTILHGWRGCGPLIQVRRPLQMGTARAPTSQGLRTR